MFEDEEDTKENGIVPLPPEEDDWESLPELSVPTPSVEPSLPVETTEQEQPVVQAEDDWEAIPELPSAHTATESPVQAPQEVDEWDTLPELYTPSTDVPEASSETLGADDVRTSPERMAVIRNYMVKRKGKQFSDMSDEDVYDTWMNHMRFFNTNEVITAGELSWLYNLPDEEKGVATNAYQLYDSLGNVFTNDGWGGAVDGVLDYTRAVLTSPSTYVGAVVGRAVVGSTTAAARTAAIQTATRMATKTAIKEAAAKGLTGAALKTAGREAATQVIAKAAKATALKQAIVATGVDAAANSLQDYMYQSARIEGKVQDDYDFLQTGISAAAGLVGGAVSIIPNATRGVSGLEDSASKITRANREIAKQKWTKAKVELDKVLPKFQKEMKDWQEMVKSGKIIAQDSTSLRMKATELLLSTDPKSETSIVNAMRKAGIFRDVRENAPQVSQQIASFAKMLPPQELAELNKSFKQMLNMNYGELVDIIAASANESGTTLQMWQQAAKHISQTSVNHAAANNVIEETAETAAKKAKEEASPEAIKYLQSVWRRALVSHPATTIVNVQGWTQAHAARALSEVIHGGVLGAAGLAARTLNPLNGNAFSDEALRKSKHLFGAQVYKLKHLVDPYTTREAAEVLFNNAPKSAAERLRNNVFGGVEEGFNTASHYGMNPDNLLIRKTEDYLDKAGRISMVKVQDMYTKSFSVLAELEKQTRFKYNMGLEDMLNAGRINEIDDEVWKKAIQTGLKDTFSADYTKGKGIIPHAAKFVEDLSNAPGVGFIFPFGRFLNNNLAFVAEYSPIAIVPMVKKAKKYGLFADETMEATSKFIVGSMALATLAAYQGTKEKEGLAWNQEMSSTGDVIDRSNMAPGSTYLALGRAINLMIRGEKVSTGLLRDIGDQLGPSKVLRDIGTASPFTPIVDYLVSINDEEADRKEFTAFIGEMLGGKIGDIASGFTRPLDPVNTVTGVVFGNDVVTDRRMSQGLSTFEEGALRYVDNIFAVFSGIATGDKERTEKPQQQFNKMGDVTEGNAVARLTGDRVEMPLTNIDRVLAAVNRPAWSEQERTGIPEWDNLMNSFITPHLERRATKLLESKIWKQANVRQRDELVTELLNTSRREARKLISERTGEGDLLNRRRQLMQVSTDLRARAKHALGIETPDRKLTAWEIDAINYFIKDERELNKEAVK